MPRIIIHRRCLITSFAMLVGNAICLADLDSAIRTIQSVGPEGKGHQQAVTAVHELSTAGMSDLVELLDGMQPGATLANNWLRAAIGAVADREVADGSPLPKRELVDYVSDQSHTAEARFVAFLTLEQFDHAAATGLIPTMLDDPCLDLRRKAVAKAIDDAKQLASDNKKTAAFQTALQSARDVDQIESIAETLKELGQEPNLVEHFGFITKWQIVGPFDHTGSKMFDVVYPPEQSPTPDLSATYEGTDGDIKWQAHATDDPLGTLDLAKAIGPHKGSIAYAFAEFTSPEDRPVEIRLGCINANKIWLNGELLTANEVYHSGTVIDQYVGRGNLLAGQNSILVKIAQNEQPESWAQRWQFQLRVCDHLGTAIYPAATPAE